MKVLMFMHQQNYFFDSCGGFLMAALTGHGKERRFKGHVITNFQLFLAVVLLLSKAALAGHKIGQNE